MEIIFQKLYKRFIRAIMKKYYLYLYYCKIKKFELDIYDKFNFYEYFLIQFLIRKWLSKIYLLI